MIKSIIFDLGNVLVNVNEEIFYSGLGLSRDVYKDNNSSLMREVTAQKKLYETAVITGREFYERVNKISNAKLTESDFQVLWNSIFTIKDGISEILSNLSKNHDLFMLSNTNELHFAAIERDYPDLIKLFKKCFLSYKIGFMKPDSEIFKNVLENIPYKAEECIYVDDIKDFTDDAKKFGFNVIAFKSIDELKKELKNKGAIL
ncbi:MAG: HAD family phosphatase [Elusimicrobiota bacterium]